MNKLMLSVAITTVLATQGCTYYVTPEGNPHNIKYINEGIRGSTELNQSTKGVDGQVAPTTTANQTDSNVPPVTMGRSSTPLVMPQPTPPSTQGVAGGAAPGLQAQNPAAVAPSHGHYHAPAPQPEPSMKQFLFNLATILAGNCTKSGHCW